MLRPPIGKVSQGQGMLEALHSGTGSKQRKN